MCKDKIGSKFFIKILTVFLTVIVCCFVTVDQAYSQGFGTLTAVGGTSKAVSVNNTIDLQVKLTVLGNNPGEGHTINFAGPTAGPQNGDASISATSGETDEDGIVTISFSSGNFTTSIDGEYKVKASYGAINPVSITFKIRVKPSPTGAAHISFRNPTDDPDYSTVDKIIRVVGSSVELNFLVTDSSFGGIKDAAVDFSISPSGSVDPTGASSANGGLVSTTATLGTTAQDYTIKAVIRGLTTTAATSKIIVTGVNAPAALRKISGDNQTGYINEKGTDLQVKVVDGDDAVVGGMLVTFSATGGTVDP